MYRMELLGDVVLVDSRFGQFGDSASVGARWVHSLHQTYHRFKSFWTHLVVLLGDEAQLES
jgi:hypothetical protein